MIRGILAGDGSIGFRKWLSALLDLLYPPHCVVCGCLGAWLCADCRESVQVLRPPICRHCGKPLDRPGICLSCERRRSYLSGIRSVAPHLPPLREAIHALKYEGVRVLARPLGEILAGYWRLEPLPVRAIVPVPLHRTRLRQRGYNQSLLLARELAERIDLPLCEGALLRERNTPSQVGLSVEERWTNVWGAFRCSNSDLRGEHVLLVDDVLTTGATLEACASTLLEAGVEEVWALTLTRAVDSPAVATGVRCRPWSGGDPQH